MSKGSVEFHDVTFLYDTASAPVLAGLSVEFARGWTGIIGANGSGKTTLLRLACRLLRPTSGRVIAAGAVAYCPQRTDDPPEHLAGLIGGAATQGQVFVEFFHNDKNAFRNSVLRLESPAHALGLSRLVVITTRGAASARPTRSSSCGRTS